MTGSANEYRRPVKPRSPYLQIFSLPGSAAFCAAAAVARMPMAMVSLGIVLALNHLYKDWATGGFMTALYVLCAAVVTPVYARLFDRFGQRSIGLLLTALQTAGFILFAAAAQNRVHLALLFVLAAYLGLTSFSIGALVRTRWAWATAQQNGSSLLDTAYSLESAVDETVFIIGPILVAFLASGGTPTLPFYVCAAAEGIGGLVFFLLPSAAFHAVDTLALSGVPEGGRTSLGPSVPPAVQDEAGRADYDSSSTVTLSGLPDQHPKRLAFMYPGMLILCCAFISFNSTFSAFDVAMTALMKSMGQERLLGLQLALFAAGSCAGAILFGSRPHHGNPWRRLVILMAYLTLGFVGIALFSRNIAVIGIIEVIAGLSVAPIFASGNLMVKGIVPASSLTEGLSWLSTASTVGAALGSAVCGRILDSFGPVAGLSSLWILTAVSLIFLAAGYMRYARRT